MLSPTGKRFWVRTEEGKRRQIVEYVHAGADCRDNDGRPVAAGTREYRMTDGEVVRMLGEDDYVVVRSGLKLKRA